MNLAWFANYKKQKLKAPHKTVLENRGFLVYCTITYSLITACKKGIKLSVEEYRPKKDNGGWERELIQQEPDPIDIFAYEEKNIKFIGQGTDPAATSEVTPPPQVEQCVQSIQSLTNLPPPLMVLL